MSSTSIATIDIAIYEHKLARNLGFLSAKVPWDHEHNHVAFSWDSKEKQADAQSDKRTKKRTYPLQRLLYSMPCHPLPCTCHVARWHSAAVHTRNRTMKKSRITACHATSCSQLGLSSKLKTVKRAGRSIENLWNVNV